jgi:uracil-DNA glycosylase family 4
MELLELVNLDQEIRLCRSCENVLVGHPEDPPSVTRDVEPRPILSQPMRAPIMLVGQAPGLTEYRTGKPFSGPAGDGIRKLFAESGLHPSEFDRAVYQTSAVKCFPGRKRNRLRWEDRQPCGTMRRRCNTFLARQIELVEPRIIVAMGVVAMSALDRLRNVRRRALWDVVGTSELWGPIRLVYLSHTSGGNRSLNDPSNRAKQARATSILRAEVTGLRRASNPGLAEKP